MFSSATVSRWRRAALPARASFSSSSPPSKLNSFPPLLLDQFGRFHNYLRVSLTERCNLRCTYCMPKEGIKLSPESDLLTSEEILRVISVFAKLGVDKIRLTGGEPTLRKDLVELCQAITAIPGIKTLAITTNGLVLKRMARDLREIGKVSAINISLDTLHKDAFEKITLRKGHGQVLEGIARCLEVGIPTIKINCVVKRGVNEHELVNFVHMTKQVPVQIRFLEHMPFDHNGWTDASVVSYAEMVERIREHFPEFHPTSPHETNSEVAKVWKVPGFAGEIGFITAMSDEFCSTCNRLRLTSDGKIKACLFGEHEVSLRQALRASNGAESEIMKCIQEAVANKHARLGGHADAKAISLTSNRPMILIGG